MLLKKKTLEKALDFISNIDFDDSEQLMIFNKVKNIISSLKDPEISKKINELNELSSDLPFKELLIQILEKLNIEQLNSIFKLLINNEELIDYLQDILLEKII
ncbi:MAG: hypothetical protein KAX33_10970 [Candidatus Lokiarchaeota archaeon]|nr:hypothetical protein [Candidatus Lokiarchaeota archaeon]MCK4281607.1 hypothetical protein [Candidatus Lokiarchaeota archaeon]